MKASNLTEQHKRLAIFGVLLLGIFMLYAPAIRLMLFHDDALNVAWMNGYNLLTIFAIDGKTGASARPMANVSWILVRELFGWYIAGVLHYWNVFLHVLNTALVVALATRMGRMFGIRGRTFPLLSALIFGIFPFSYQAVLWAGAVYHPALTAYGLLMIHAYLTARRRGQLSLWLLSALLLLGACLSHESGVALGGVVLIIEAAYALTIKQRLHVGAVALCALALAYLLAYRLLFSSMWMLASYGPGGLTIFRIVTNYIYFAQALVSWLLILLRSQIGLTESSTVIIVGLFGLSVALALVLLWRVRALTLGLVSLAWWVIMLAPASLLLEVYVRLSPRLLYASSVGIALLWGGVTAVLLRRMRHWTPRVALLGCVTFFCAWCVPYIADRLNETARLTPAMQAIDDDLHASEPSAKVLLINMPHWNAPAYPAFLIGAEGMPIFQSENAPAWTWLETVSGVRREMTYVRHDSSLTKGDRFVYGIPGEVVDDVVLRATILSSNYTYRFDYDPPGLRARRLAVIGDDQTETAPLAWLADGTARTAIRSASAVRCDDTIMLDLTWSDARDMVASIGVFIHIFDEQNRQVTVADRDLIDGYLPLDQMPPNVVITETRQINIPVHAVSLKEIHVGAYRHADGKRMNAMRADGSVWESDAVAVPVQRDAPKLCRQLGL